MKTIFLKKVIKWNLKISEAILEQDQLLKTIIKIFLETIKEDGLREIISKHLRFTKTKFNKRSISKDDEEFEQAKKFSRFLYKFVEVLTTLINIEEIL